MPGSPTRGGDSKRKFAHMGFDLRCGKSSDRTFTLPRRVTRILDATSLQREALAVNATIPPTPVGGAEPLVQEIYALAFVEGPGCRAPCGWVQIP